MNFIVLLKQVPDISRIPPNAWDHQKGTLKRNVLESVLNPLDLHALTLACRMRAQSPVPAGKIVALTMGPPQARDVLLDAIARGADQGVLLTDGRFAGSDTVATAYALSAAIRKIEQEIFAGDKAYTIVAGVQSTDGDTAQVPPQVAEELGVDLVSYVEDFTVKEDWQFRRIGPSGVETVLPQRFPLVVTTTDCSEPLYPSFARARPTRLNKDLCLTWRAEDLAVDEKRIGFEGSRTQVVHIFSTHEGSGKECVFLADLDALVANIKARLAQTAGQKKEVAKSLYQLSDKSASRKGEVWIFAETAEAELAPVTIELLGKARELADNLQEPVAAMLVAADSARWAADLIAYGADRVYLVEQPELENFVSSPYASVLASLVKERNPQIVLFGATPLGRELAPRIAYATGAGLTADCTKLEIGDYRDQVAALLQTRPALGGNIMATIVTRIPAIQMATVRPGVFSYPPQDPGRRGEVIKCVCPIPECHVEIALGETRERAVTLSSARIIVAGGAGLRNSANFQEYIVPLAQHLEKYFQLPAAVAGSRKAVEMGIVARDHQVGQTGQTVEPDLYFAVGISGAIQHISGMQKSGVLVAINPDPHAPVFKLADWGVVGKAETVIPRLLEQLAVRVGNDGKS